MHSLVHNVQTGYGATRATYQMVSGEIPKGIKRPKREADNLLHPKAEVKNGRATYILSSTTSTPAMAPIQWLQGNFLGDLAAKVWGWQFTTT
jgi:hypothetical protein